MVFLGYACNIIYYQLLWLLKSGTYWLAVQFNISIQDDDGGGDDLAFYLFQHYLSHVDMIKES